MKYFCDYDMQYRIINQLKQVKLKTYQFAKVLQFIETFVLKHSAHSIIMKVANNFCVNSQHTFDIFKQLNSKYYTCQIYINDEWLPLSEVYRYKTYIDQFYNIILQNFYKYPTQLYINTTTNNHKFYIGQLEYNYHWFFPIFIQDMTSFQWTGKEQTLVQSSIQWRYTPSRQLVNTTDISDYQKQEIMAYVTKLKGKKRKYTKNGDK